jgi:hypothetical protein
MENPAKAAIGATEFLEYRVTMRAVRVHISSAGIDTFALRTWILRPRRLAEYVFAGFFGRDLDRVGFDSGLCGFGEFGRIYTFTDVAALTACNEIVWGVTPANRSCDNVIDMERHFWWLFSAVGTAETIAPEHFESQFWFQTHSPPLS